MRHPVVLALVIALLTALAACKSSQTRKQEKLQLGDIAFVGATVVPMDREQALTGHTVVVRDDRIALVAPAATLDTSAAKVIDVSGKWIVPGLADMHVHTQSERDLAMYLLSGVTTVRDMFGSPQHLEWRAAQAVGKLAAPTLITSGPIVDGDPPVWPGSTVVTDAETARAAVRAQKQAGYDFIKVYSKLSPDAYAAIVAEAKAQNIPFAGHVPTAVGLDKVLDSGQRSIEHLDGYLSFGAEPRTDAEIVKTTVAMGVWNCPTLVVLDRMGRLDDPASLASTPGLSYVDASVRQRWDPKNDFRLKSWTPEMFANMRATTQTARKLVADLARAGAPLVLGTDTGNPYVVPGFAVHDESALLVGSGLTPYQAIRAATVAAAELAGTPGAFGVIAPGARADLIVVDRDPLRDIAALAQPSLVVVRGMLHERGPLVAAVEKPPADPLAALPELELEGEKLATARYEILMNGGVIGKERALISKLDDGTRVVRGQAAFMPSVVFQYRATPDRVEYADGLTVVRDGKKVIATPRGGTPVELATTANAVIAPQSVAEFVWYAERLAKMRVGGTAKLAVAAVMVERDVRLDPATFTFKRLPDRDGRRAYEISGKHGQLDLTGSFTLDADGAPREIEVKVKFGTFVTRRVD